MPQAKKPIQFRNPEEDPRRAEDEIRGVAGVMSCRVVSNPKGEILEIHVVASPERRPKQIIRDIETVLLASLDVRIDHKKVSVAQIPAGRPAKGREETDPQVVAPVRLRFLALRTSLTPEGGEIEVTLGRDRFHGFGKAAFTISGDPTRAVVEATVQAVARFLRSGGFQVGSVQQSMMGTHQAVFVQVEHVTSGRSVPLLGSALVLRDPNLSALFATLDAVNRYMGRLDATTGVEWVAGPVEPATS